MEVDRTEVHEIMHDDHLELPDERVNHGGFSAIESATRSVGYDVGCLAKRESAYEMKARRR
jgi:hypothetical protein